MTATTESNPAVRPGSAHEILRSTSGRLFYKSYANEFTDIANTAREPLFPFPMLIRWRRLLETRARLLKLRGLRLNILLAPDAHFIYREEVPEHVVLPARSPARQFTESFSDIDNVVIVNPEAALIEARGGIDVYKANDTHWSAHGAFIGYRKLLGVLPGSTPMRPVTAADVSYRLVPSFGDLGSLVEPEVRINMPIAEVRGGATRLTLDHAGEGRNAWKRFESARGRGHAFIVRDSFSTEMGIFVNETFARVDWIGGTSRLHLEAIDEEKPDVVVWQLAERRLMHVEHDHHPRTAYELYAFDRSTPFGKQALDAYLLQVAGNLAEALSQARAAVEAPEAGAPYHYLLADLLQANSHMEEAEAAIRHAIELQDNRPAYWHLLSVISRHRGNLAAAAAASERAVQLFAHNACFVADHGYNLMHSERLHEAIDAMQSCREHVSDAPHLSYWLARAHLMAGNVHTARREAINAYLLLPDHPDVFRLIWQIEDYCEKLPRSTAAPHAAAGPAGAGALAAA